MYELMQLLDASAGSRNKSNGHVSVLMEQDTCAVTKILVTVLRQDIRKKLFMMRVVKHWHRLPREMGDAPSLEMFKVRLEGALSYLS